jgi:hypothetical protein
MAIPFLKVVLVVLTNSDDKKRLISGHSSAKSVELSIYSDAGPVALPLSRERARTLFSDSSSCIHNYIFNYFLL